MMSDMSYRRHGRTALQCEVTLEHDAIGEVVAEAKDVSETGILVKCKDLVGKLAVGQALKAKVCRNAECTPPSEFKVARLTDDGAALTSS